jgi:1,4-alpha-glucan branching enzyme
MTEFLPKSGILLLFVVLIQGCVGPSLFTEGNAVRPCLFTYRGPAQSVCISGDFNNWSPDSHCMRKQKGLWSILLMLPTGIYRYAFVIDGRDWVVDPKALYAETDGFGHRNAVTIID